MLVNACYWAVGVEGKIPDKSDVTIVGDYTPLPFRFRSALAPLITTLAAVYPAHRAASVDPITSLRHE